MKRAELKIPVELPAEPEPQGGEKAQIVQPAHREEHRHQIQRTQEVKRPQDHQELGERWNLGVHHVPGQTAQETFMDHTVGSPAARWFVTGHPPEEAPPGAVLALPLERIRLLGLGDRRAAVRARPGKDHLLLALGATQGNDPFSCSRPDRSPGCRRDS